MFFQITISVYTFLSKIFHVAYNIYSDIRITYNSSSFSDYGINNHLNGYVYALRAHDYERKNTTVLTT